MITKQTVIDQVSQYLHKEISLAALVDWAETCLMDETFEESEHDAIRDAVARLAASDVQAFGLTWEDCERIVNSLGYSARVVIDAR
ncbi:MAG: hypothetical protein GC154_13440 [bacterium]|nr:hypothetical protein [bacterium]